MEENTTIPEVEQSVVLTRVLAELATQSSISVSDEVINNYLGQAGFNRVGGDEIVGLLKGLSVADRQANVDVLFAALRENLLAHYYQSGNLYPGQLLKMGFLSKTISYASQTIMPEQRWEDWRRVNDRIALEAAILPVDRFIADVPDPTDAQIQAFYDTHKDRVSGQMLSVMGAVLPSPNPGFTQPRRVRLHYLLGDVFRLSEKLADTVSDEEIAEYYERNKRTQFVRAATSVFETEEASDDVTDSATDSTRLPTAEPAATDKNPAASESVESEDSNVDTSNGEESKKEKAEDSSTGQPPDSQPADSQPAEQSDSAPDKTPDEDSSATPDETSEESSSLTLQSPFHLVAFQEEETVADEQPSNSSTDDEKVAKDAAETVEDRAENDVAESNIDGSTEVSSPADNESTDNQEADRLEVDEVDEVDEVEYQPLEEVKEEIRRQLATEKAVVQLKDEVEQLFDKLQAAYNPYGEARAIAQAEGNEPPAAPQQFADLLAEADQYDLTFEKTPLLSGRELVNDSIVGKAIDAQTGRANVAQLVFGKLDLYEPAMAQDIDGNWYLVFKVEDDPQHVPELESIRGEVIQAWKQQEAGKLALAKSESLAAEAQSAGGSLKDSLAGEGYDVVTTDMFSWLSFGTTPVDMQRGPRLGEAPPLESVGPDFMAKAFELKNDEVAGLLNYDQTIAYVVRLDRREQSEAELRKLFLSEVNSWFGGQFTTVGRWQQFQSKVFDRLFERVGLVFEEGWDQQGR